MEGIPLTARSYRKSFRLQKQFVYKQDTLLLKYPLDSSHDVNIFRSSDDPRKRTWRSFEIKTCDIT